MIHAHLPARPGTLLAPVGAGALLACLMLWSLPAAGSAQLRPLDPLDWAALEGEGRSVEVGSGFYTGQRASLAGTEGRLLEMGVFAATWSLGRVALRLAGTAVRVFEDQYAFADSWGGALPFHEGRRRTDTGDHRVSTLVGLTAPGSRVGAALRFGVRLPTTDNVQGLGRDQTDFFSSLGGRVVRDAWTVNVEVGLGVNGTRDPTHEQIDPLLFAVAARWRNDGAEPFLELVGQHDTRAGPEPRGAENLGEARLGIQIGDQRWLRVTGVRGLTRMGPELGLEVRMGTGF